MLRMRSEQMEVFRPVADAAFERRLVQHLRQAHPTIAVRLLGETTPLAQLADPRLHELVRNGIARGRAYGLTWQSSLAGFVVLTFVAAPNFDAHPLVRRVLQDERMPADLRIDQLWRRTTRKTWETIRQRYDPTGWQKPAPGTCGARL
jgi:hypothetical protein